MYSDIRLALRQLLAAKGFTITAMLTLALGLGANTGIFTLVHALLMKSLPVADPERVVRVGDGDNCCVLGGYQGRFSVYSYSLYNLMREHTPEFEEMSAFQAGTDKVGVRRAGSNTSDAFVDQFVSGTYFSLFGLRPFAGRLLTASDDVRNAPPVAVMSYRVWQQQYGGDRAILGSQFIIEGAPFTIVGIAPPGFFGAEMRPDPPDFWMPLAMEPMAHGKNALLDQNAHWLNVFGRMRPGASAATAEARLNGHLQQWLRTNDPPATARQRQELDKQHITLAPGGAGITAMKENYQQDLRLLLGITALVLLIACANLANLQLARGAALAGQTSIRMALGAPQHRIIRQVLLESAILSIGGGALGLLVASQTAGLLIRLAFRGATYVPIDTTPSLPILAFAFLLSLVTGIVFGIAPSLVASRTDPAAALHGAGRSAAGRSSLPQKTLVLVQAALSLVLLTGAGLMLRTLHNLTAQQFGFPMQGSMMVSVNAGFRGYAPEKMAYLYREVERQIREIPGVRSVGLALYSPMSGNNWQMGASIEGRPQARINPSWDRVSPGFFEAMGVPVRRGRLFDERDTPDATHVAVVNQAFADSYFPNEDPIGKRFGLGGEKHAADYTIVGVVNTIRFRNPRGPGRPMFFLPMLQMWKNEWEDNTKARSNLIQSIQLRVSGSTPPDLAPRIQRVLGAIDPNLTMLGLYSTSELLSQLLEHEHLIGVLSEVFGLLALVLASVGLYGVTAYGAARRTAEIGVRTALGATRGQVVRLILRGALMQTTLGVAVGIPVALAAGGLLSKQLYGVEASDPVILAAAAATLLACATIAGTIPAARASSVDPVTALRLQN
jgi:predicted permease